MELTGYWAIRARLKRSGESPAVVSDSFDKNRRSITVMRTRAGGRAAGDRGDRTPGMQTFLPLLIVAAGVAVYFNGLDCGFVLDDGRWIAENLRIRQLWPVGPVLSGRRPTFDLSLAINYAFGGVDVLGYHAVNLLIHLVAGLSLYGIVRRTLLLDPFRNALGRSSAMLAAAVALLWTVHPLQTQSVTYLTQRSESLMGMFYLLTLYCLVRGAGPSRRVFWYATGVACCALGMGSKAVMVTAPVVILLYDRVFLSSSFAEALRRRWALYLGLAGTWSVVWWTGVGRGVLSSSHRVATVGFSYKGITPAEYAQTQFGVLVKYLSLSLWPDPLCLDYTWPVARTAAAIFFPALLVTALIGGVVWAFLRRPWLGFLGAWFFLILAPTSSVIPIKDPLFEHRMYLPLAAVVTLAVIVGRQALHRLAAYRSLSDSKRTLISVMVVLAIGGSLGYGTIRRNEDYRDELTMWQDVVTKRPDNVRARYNLGSKLLEFDRVDEAAASLRAALKLDPHHILAHYNLGKCLARTGNADEAAQQYLEALRIDPNMADAHSDLGNVLARKGRSDEAIVHYREAIRANPQYIQAYYNLGAVLLGLQETDEAVEVLRQGAQVSPEAARIRFALGNAYAQQGEITEATREYRKTLQIQPGHTGAQRALDAALRGQRSHDRP